MDNLGTLEQPLEFFPAHYRIMTMRLRAPAKKSHEAGETPALPVFRVKSQWSAGVPPAMRAAGSRTAGSFISVRGGLSPRRLVAPVG
jgi:hypothetical protein